jgi:hypothetical protein
VTATSTLPVHRPGTPGYREARAGVLLVRTVPSGPVEVDPQTRRARIPAGTRWGAVADAAAAYGLGGSR